MQIGDKVIINPRLKGMSNGIDIDRLKGKILTISDTYLGYCFVEEETYLFRMSMFIPVEKTLRFMILKRRSYETR